MASVTSTRGSTLITYVITDQESNTVTVTAPINPGAPGGITTTFSGGVLQDGQALLNTLLQMLSTGLRPNAIVGQTASFSN